jgi:xanthine dehydrogenase accessory factor
MLEKKPFLVLIRGGGDLGSGVALRLHRSGIHLFITELEQPLVVRRLVSFAEAIYRDETIVEGVVARKVNGSEQVLRAIAEGIIPVLVDPKSNSRHKLQPDVLVDARMTKRPPDLEMESARFVVGLGPGYIAGENCHAVIETKRGHMLGRVIWEGAAEPNTGIPDNVMEKREERVLRAPGDGVLESHAEIGEILEEGQPVAEVKGQIVAAPFHGVLRGLVHPGLKVFAGMKIGDIDPRADPRFARLVSDKSLAIGGGVLEAILSKETLRRELWI